MHAAACRWFSQKPKPYAYLVVSYIVPPDYSTQPNSFHHVISVCTTQALFSTYLLKNNVEQKKTVKLFYNIWRLVKIIRVILHIDKIGICRAVWLFGYYVKVSRLLITKVVALSKNWMRLFTHTEEKKIRPFHLYMFKTELNCI